MIPLPHNSKWLPKTGSSFIVARMVVFEEYLSRLSCFPGRQIECQYCHLNHTYPDVTFLDGGGKVPQPY